MIAHIGKRIGCCIIGYLSAAGLAYAQLTVPSGATVALDGGTLDLAATSLQLGGTFSIGSGNLDGARNIAIAAGGTLDGGSGLITLFGDWSNLGGFNHGSGTVSWVDGGSGQSNISGNSTFNNASFVSASGKNFSFAVGNTQTVGGLLTILGTPALGIQFKSASPGQVAFIDLLPGGSQSIQHVGVSNVHATGQHLAPNQSNDGGTGDALGWFGSGGGGAAVTPTPALTVWALLSLALLLIGSTAVRNARCRD